MSNAIRASGLLHAASALALSAVFGAACSNGTQADVLNARGRDRETTGGDGGQPNAPRAGDESRPTSDGGGGTLDGPVVDATAPDATSDGGDGFPVGDPGTTGDGEFVVEGPYETQPDLTDRGAPRGKAFRFTMDSTKSVIFDGKDTTLDPGKRELTREINVYVPAQYKDGTPAALLIIQDGGGPIDLVARALDNLTISADVERQLPPFIVVAVQNGGSDSKGSERGLEYDTMSDRYARFIEFEVLPAVLADGAIKSAYPGLSFTKNPEGRGTLGCSSGGSAALIMGFFRPDLFRRIVTYSGTFVDQQDDDAAEEALYPLGAWDFHSGMELFKNTPQKPLRIFLNVNESDNGANDPESGHHNWVMANRRTSAALAAKGYHRRFVYGRGAGHCDGGVQRSTLADALVWTWRGYPAK